MKEAVKRIIKDEKGRVMELVLIMLTVGGLVLAPLLGLMSTGLLAGQVYEKKTDELYAADAGVEDAVWKIQNNVDEVKYLYCGGGNHSWSYPEPGDPPFDVNNKSVAVTITWVNNETAGASYKITSIATGSGDSSTTIESYVTAQYTQADLLKNAITSLNDVTVKSGSSVNGTVQYGGSLDNKGTISGTTVNERYQKWPEFQDLSNYYLANVTGAPDPGPSINIKNTKTLGPAYRNGSLSVDNTGSPDTLTIQNTVYVNGSLTFNQPGASKNYTINLNGKTIFVTGSITFPSQRVSVTGTGCIIARGDINFQPGMQSSPNNFVFVMSIEGKLWFHPSGDFYGSLAGDTEVDLWPGTHLTWNSVGEGAGLNFPIEAYRYQTNIGTVAIQTWEVNPQ